MTPTYKQQLLTPSLQTLCFRIAACCCRGAYWCICLSAARIQMPYFRCPWRWYGTSTKVPSRTFRMARSPTFLVQFRQSLSEWRFCAMPSYPNDTYPRLRERQRSKENHECNPKELWSCNFSVWPPLRRSYLLSLLVSPISRHSCHLIVFESTCRSELIRQFSYSRTNYRLLWLCSFLMYYWCKSVKSKKYILGFSAWNWDIGSQSAKALQTER